MRDEAKTWLFSGPSIASSKEEGREVGKKIARACRARGLNPGPEPGTCCMLGEGPQLHAMGVV